MVKLFQNSHLHSGFTLAVQSLHIYRMYCNGSFIALTWQ